MKVSVFGLGYVGAVSCGCFAHDGMEVIGVDVNPDKVALINAGRAPILEERIGEMISETVATGRLRATTDVEEAVLGTDVSVVSVGTPSNPAGSLNLTAVERVSEQIGRALARKPSRHTVVVRSTVMPGTVRDLVIPTLQRESGKSAGGDISVCFNPEFLREGSSVQDHYNPPFTLIGDLERSRRTAGRRALPRGRSRRAHRADRNRGNGQVCLQRLSRAENLVRQRDGHDCPEPRRRQPSGHGPGLPRHQTEYLAALHEPRIRVRRLLSPKDVRALLYKAREMDVDTPLTKSILDTNRSQMDRAINLILSFKKRKIAMLGITFKAGTDDLRESPLVNVTEALIGKGQDVRIYDSNISLARLTGANKKYIEGEIPHISSLLLPDLKAAVTHGDILVIGNRAPEFTRLKEVGLRDQTVIDLARIPGLRRGQGYDYHGITW